MAAPERRHRTKCRVCKAPIVWARTLATVNGAGGKAMPLDADPNPAGNVAARLGPGHRIIARVLTKDETHDNRVEWRAMPHFATCGQQLVPEIEAFLAEQAAKQEGASS